MGRHGRRAAGLADGGGTGLGTGIGDAVLGGNSACDGDGAFGGDAGATGGGVFELRWADLDGLGGVCFAGLAGCLGGDIAAGGAGLPPLPYFARSWNSSPISASRVRLLSRMRPTSSNILKTSLPRIFFMSAELVSAMLLAMPPPADETAWTT